MNELGLTAKFIRQTLLADPVVTSLVQTRIHRNRAPKGSGLPYIVFTLVISRDKNAIGAKNRLFTRPLYTIKAVTEGEDDTTGDAIATAIDDALTGKSDFIGADGLIKLGVFREEPFDFAEEQEGVQYNHIGGQYRIFVQRTP